MDDSKLDAGVLSAFVLVVLVGGSNIVAVRITNRDLDPFWGAGIRFAIAAALLLTVTRVAKIPLPTGRALTGAVIFGFLNFTAAYAFLYWALQRVPAALAGVIMGSIPLLTFVLALVHRIERFRWRALFGAVLAACGVAVMVGSPANAAVPLLSVGAMAAGAVCAAESGIVIKHFPSSHPIAMNAVSMAIGTPLLFALSLAFGERWEAPSQISTWYILAYLIPVGSVALFILYVYVVQRWTASGASYQFVLFPLVTAVLAAWVADEPLTISVAFGGLLVLAGVYVGALASTKRARRFGRTTPGVRESPR